MKNPIPKILIICVAAFAGLFPAVHSAADYEIQDIMNGNVSGISVVVNGSGQGYYGQSLLASFNNNTGGNLSIRVPIGLSMVPANSGVQTMYTAGGETINVPPGNSQSLIIAFCGEQHDAGPGRSDTFSAGSFATGSLLQTLHNINQAGNFGRDAQQAVWHHTDGADISNNETASELASGFGASGTTAAAGLAAAVLAGGTALLINRFEGSSQPVPDEDPYFVVPGETIDNNYQGEPQDDTLPPELRPPIEIADIPPPEDPADGIMIAGGDDGFFQTIYNLIREGGKMDPQPPAVRPSIFGPPPPEDESWWQQIQRYTGWGQSQTPEERDAQDAANARAGQVIKNNAPFGSGGKLNSALSGDDPSQLVQQVNREKVEEGATDGIRIIRRLMNLTSLTNSQGGARDMSGFANIARDYVEPDARGLIDTTGIYQKDAAAHQAWQQYFDKHSALPDPNNPGDVREFMDIYNRIKD